MQARQFRQLTTTERKAKFIQALISKSEGKLSKEQLETIANYRWQIGYRDRDGLAQDHDLIDAQMSIVVHDNAKDFGTAATLVHQGMEHSWAGERYTRSFGNWIVGDGDFGFSKNLEYSSNGDIGSPDTEEESPDFDLEKTNVIAVKTVDHDSFNRNATEHEEKWELHILLSGSAFPVDPVIAEIVKQFNL